VVAGETADFIPLTIRCLLFKQKLTPILKIFLSSSRRKRAKDNLLQKVPSIGNQRKGQKYKAAQKNSLKTENGGGILGSIAVKAHIFNSRP
jgi:hypothetical protein